MKPITLKKYAPVISDKSIGDEIYTIINSEILKSSKVAIDMSTIKSMATSMPDKYLADCIWN
jgi:hypothetical protein